MKSIQITSLGIIKALKNHNYSSSIAEYIWNGFDAKATQIDVIMECDDFGAISELKIIDNGSGIADSNRFTIFYESNKQSNLSTSKTLSPIHGNNGIGRLTFFTFCSSARWDTVYEKDGKRFKYNITINSKQLDNYDISEEIATDEPTGTTVSFHDIMISGSQFDTDIKPYLYREFSWFLELNSIKNLSIKINKSNLNYQDIVGDSIQLEHKIGEYLFDFRFIRWSQSLNKEYSRYYFINSEGEGIYTNTTTLNHKGDKFSHSVFVRSIFFDQEHFFPYEIPTLKNTKNSKIYHSLINFINLQLQNQRKTFLKQKSDQVVENLRKNAFPKFKNNAWDRIRRDQLEDFIKELYQAEPKIFISLNLEQQKIFVHFLNLLLDSDDRDKLVNVLGEVMKLDSSTLEHLSESLKVTTLNNIIKTIRLIEDRNRAIAQLKTLVFDWEKLGTNERDHIQKFVENHYWIIGEQYHLVTAAEPKFEEAMRRYIYILKGEKPVVSIDHPDKNKEMDIFMVRQLFNNSSINNVVLELKHPKTTLGSKELDQVKTYMNVIMEQDVFNASNMSWEFYLIGNNFNKYITNEIESSKYRGEKSLVHWNNKYKIYVKTWSEIFTEFDLKHKFLNDKLELDKAKLNIIVTNANEVINNIHTNSAVQPAQRAIPQN